MTNSDRVPATDPTLAQRRELSEGKTWDEMTASERAAYAARKRWDARRDARHNAEHEHSPSPDGDAGFGSAEPMAPPLSHEEAAILEMRRIIDDPDALDTSKVQAARALAVLTEERNAGQNDEVALWLARRDAIAALPPQDALNWLLGELKEGADDDPPAAEGEEDPADVADLVTTGRGI